MRRLFDGGYELQTDRLRVTARFAGQPRPPRLVLERGAFLAPDR